MKTIGKFVVLSVSLLVFVSATFGQGTAKPKLVFDEVIKGMPVGTDQEVRVFTASFKPGDKTVFHDHRFPVTVYILEGAFTLELEGRKEPVSVKAGEAFVEPPNVKMMGFNRSAAADLQLVIFYVSDKGTPFLDMIEGQPMRH